MKLGTATKNIYLRVKKDCKQDADMGKRILYLYYLEIQCAKEVSFSCAF